MASREFRIRETARETESGICPFSSKKNHQKKRLFAKIAPNPYLLRSQFFKHYRAKNALLVGLGEVRRKAETPSNQHSL